MNQNPLVSICTTAYNRSKYIAQAIDSFLMQKTNFNFEIVISDNCSTDNTVEIVEAYIEKYPDKIRLFKSDKNYGLLINYIKSISVAKGKYIATCDSDDYWTDEYKIQKQVDFMEQNPDFIMCFTNTMLLIDDTGEYKPAKEHIWDTATTKELLTYNSIGLKSFKNDIHCPAHASTFFFRNNVISFPEWYKECYINDEPIFLMLSKFGKAKFINEMMTVYRIYSTSYSSFEFSRIFDWNGRIHFYKNLDDFFEGKFHKELKQIIRTFYFNIAKEYFRKKLYFKSFINLVKSTLFVNILKLNKF